LVVVGALWPTKSIHALFIQWNSKYIIKEDMFPIRIMKFVPTI
jgi:hypothetical protein